MSVQIAKLIARIAENLPEMTPGVMQGLIENPKALQVFLKGLCDVTTVVYCDACNIRTVFKDGRFECLGCGKTFPVD